MKVRNIIVSIAAASVLFTACGGGGGGTPPAPSTNYGDLKAKTKTSYNVLAKQASYIAVLTGSKFINTDTSDSYYQYIVKDKGTAKTAKFDPRNYGVLRYENSGATDTVIVAIKDTRDGKESEPITLTFNVVGESSVQEAKILKTGQTDGDYGETRNFKRDNNTRFNVKDEVSGLIWNDLSSNVTPMLNVTFAEADKECRDQGKRLPTTEELYGTILYKSDNFKKNMLDQTFKTLLTYSWASDGKMMNNTLGYVVGSGKAEFRCVDGDNLVVEHVMMTDLVSEDTYDLSTKLQWSKGSATKMSFAEGKTYCENMKNDWDHTGWTLPTINQLRSIVDSGVVTASVIHSNSDLLSSTQVKDDTGTFYLGLIPTQERTDYTISPFNDTQAATITCVRPYSDGELAQVKQQ